MKYSLCCNQAKHCWEILDKDNNVIFSGKLKEVEEYIKIHN